MEEEGEGDAEQGDDTGCDGGGWARWVNGVEDVWVVGKMSVIEYGTAGWNRRRTFSEDRA